jgi:hypothetical protein
MNKNDIDVKFKAIDIASEAAHQKVELNLIYLLAEFIDNSKSSYEDMLNNNYSGMCDINISFNQEKEYIMIEDFAGGFDVLNKLSKKGLDNVTGNGTNMYNVGMKSALDYFSDHALVFSKKVDNDNAEMGFWIRKIGVNSEKIVIDHLPNNKNSGTQIFLFKGSKNLKEFLASDYPDKSFNVEIENGESERNTVSDILDNLEVTFPAVTQFIFSRYSSLVNKRNQIRINFDIVNSSGVSGVENYITNRNRLYPKYLNVIEKNNFFENSTFNFDNYKKAHHENWEVYWNLPSKQKVVFMNELSNKLYDVWKKDLSHFKDLDRKYKYNIQTKIKYFDTHFLNGNIAMDFGNNDKFKYIEYLEVWKKQSAINKAIVNGLMNLMLNDNSDVPVKLELEFKNLTVIDNEIVFDGGLVDKRVDLFNIKVNFFFEDSKYSNFNYRDTKVYQDNRQNYNFFFTPDRPDNQVNNKKLLVGFDIVQNDRALRHGPNLDNSQLVRKSPLTAHSIPKKFMSDYLSIAQNEFPAKGSKKATRDNPFTFTSGGNIANHSQIVFGDIEIPNNSVFKPGQDKASFEAALLEGFMRDIFVIFDINAIVTIIKSLNNNKDELEIYALINDLVKAKVNAQVNAMNIEKIEKKQDDLKLFGLERNKEDFLISKTDNTLSVNEQEEVITNELNDIIRAIQKNNVLFIKLDQNEKALRQHFNRTKIIENGLSCSLIIDNFVFKKWKNEVIIKMTFDSNGSSSYNYDDDEPIILNISCAKERRNENFGIIIKYIMILINRIEVITSIKHLKITENIKDDISDNELEKTLEKIIKEAI